MPEKRTIILRHDVDLQPWNALKIAKLEHEIGIAGSYYFRSVSQSFNEIIINQIASLGHEIGYHYENLSTYQGNMDSAIQDFEKNLKRFRKLVPVATICMHGSPLNRWDSRLLWEKYNYRDFGIIGEPYFDIDFTKVLYLTDTGRRWSGEKYNVRDKIRAESKVRSSELLNLRYNFQSTFDIIRAAERGELPDKIMINMHPQRWNDKPLPWLKEFIGQNVKNVIKRYFFVR